MLTYYYHTNILLPYNYVDNIITFYYPNDTTAGITQQAADGRLWKLLVGPAQQVGRRVTQQQQQQQQQHNSTTRVAESSPSNCTF
jgi:hypothetical protein